MTTPTLTNNALKILCTRSYKLKAGPGNEATYFIAIKVRRSEGQYKWELLRVQKVSFIPS
jgi:hypothetical protein